MLLAVDALRAIGVAELTVDLNLPTLVAAVAAGLKLPAETLRRLRRALDRKDEGGIAKALGDGKGDSNKKAADLFVGLLRAAGPGRARHRPADGAQAAGGGGGRGGAARRGGEAGARRRPDLPLTLDPVEYRGLEYQTGVSFSVFALKGRQELARGGRYSAGYPEDGVSEPATGFTLYMDAVLAASERGARAAAALPAARHAVERGRPLAGQRLCRRARRDSVCRSAHRGQAAALQPRPDRQGSRAALGGRLPFALKPSSAGPYRRRKAPSRALG